MNLQAGLLVVDPVPICLMGGINRMPKIQSHGFGYEEKNLILSSLVYGRNNIPIFSEDAYGR